MKRNGRNARPSARVGMNFRELKARENHEIELRHKMYDTQAMVDERDTTKISRLQKHVT